MYVVIDPSLANNKHTAPNPKIKKKLNILHIYSDFSYENEEKQNYLNI